MPNFASHKDERAGNLLPIEALAAAARLAGSADRISTAAQQQQQQQQQRQQQQQQQQHRLGFQFMCAGAPLPMDRAAVRAAGHTTHGASACPSQAKPARPSHNASWRTGPVRHIGTRQPARRRLRRRHAARTLHHSTRVRCRGPAQPRLSGGLAITLPAWRVARLVGGRVLRAVSGLQTRLLHHLASLRTDIGRWAVWWMALPALALPALARCV